MKKTLLSVALVAAGLALSGCSTNFADATYDLTVTVSGVASAPVVVYDVTKGTNVYEVSITGSKTFTALTGGRTYRVTGGAVTGYNASAAQDIVLSKSSSVTVTYTKE